LAEVSEPVTFSRKIEGSMSDLIVPNEFIRDFHFLSDKELTIIMQIWGPDLEKSLNFFNDGIGDEFTIKTVESDGKQVSDKFTLIDMETDEGPHLWVDIDIEPPAVKIVVEFEKK